MISTNRQLTLTPMDPIHDEASGIANLECHQQRGGGALAAGLLSLAFAVGIVAGGLITTVLFLLSHL